MVNQANRHALECDQDMTFRKKGLKADLLSTEAWVIDPGDADEGFVEQGLYAADRLQPGEMKDDEVQFSRRQPKLRRRYFNRNDFQYRPRRQSLQACSQRRKDHGRGVVVRTDAEPPQRRCGIEAGHGSQGTVDILEDARDFMTQLLG